MPIEIERCAGLLVLSHGTVDTVWSVEVTKRLPSRLKRHDRRPEVHGYEGADDLSGKAGENEHHDHLVSVFDRHLSVSKL